MDSRTIYLVGWALGAVALVTVGRDQTFGGLFVPAGACIVIAAVLNRGRGRAQAQGELGPWFTRGIALAVGTLWIFLGAWLLANG